MYIFLCFGWENHDALHLIRWNGKQLCSLYLLVSSMISTILIFFQFHSPSHPFLFLYKHFIFQQSTFSHAHQWLVVAFEKKSICWIYLKAHFSKLIFFSSLKLKNATFQTSLSAVCKNKCSSSYKIFFFSLLVCLHTVLLVSLRSYVGKLWLKDVWVCVF